MPHAAKYAKWLMTSDYVPFEQEVGGYTGLLKSLAFLPPAEIPHPRKVVEHAKHEVEIAQDVAKGGEAPDGWPGERPLTVMTARVKAAREEAKRLKSNPNGK